MSDKRRVDRISAGDWVKGTTVNDERIRGYVQHFDPMTSIYTVKVVQSDRDESVGRTVFAKGHQVQPLPVDVLEDAVALRHLIDLSLFLKDRSWFYELTDKLKSVERGAPGTLSRTPAAPS